MVAIDIAKLRNEVLIEQPGRTRRQRLRINNTDEDLKRLVNHLQDLGGSVQIGFELHLISSMALARTREALHNGWDKNDPKDAQVMLHMLRVGNTQGYYDTLLQGINDWQELSKTHEMVSEAMHRLQTHYLPLYFPEIDRFRHNSRSEWFFSFLDRFPVPAAITASSREQFIEQAWTLIGRKVAKVQILKDIYATARTSIGLPVSLESPAVAMYRVLIDHIRLLIRQRDQIELKAQELLQTHPDYRCLRQLPGVGPIP